MCVPRMYKNKKNFQGVCVSWAVLQCVSCVLLLLQIRSWGSAPATPAESSAPAPSSLPWNAEIAELLVALDLLCNREIQLLPKELIRRELGLQTAAVAHR